MIVEVIFNCQVEVGYGLCLDSLGGIYHQQCSFACGDGPRYLIREIDMSRGIDQVQHIVFTLVSDTSSGWRGS